jgi:hypothetical protein
MVDDELVGNVVGHLHKRREAVTGAEREARYADLARRAQEFMESFVAENLVAG